MSERTALYRLWDAEDGLLYVGVAARPEFRWTQHADEKEWWPQVRRYDVEWHPDREAALLAEKTAILEEEPLHNITHSEWRAELDPASGRYRRVRRPQPAPHRAVRVPDAGWNDLGAATAHMDSDRAKALNQFIEWYLRRPGAKLPERPTKDFTDTLTGEEPEKRGRPHKQPDPE